MKPTNKPALPPQGRPQVLFALLLVLVAVVIYRNCSGARTTAPPPESAAATSAPEIAEKTAPPPSPEPQLSNTSLPPTPVPSTTALATPPPTGPAQTTEQFQTEFKKCFPQRAVANSLQDFVVNLLNSTEVEQREPTLENISINDGSREQRISILPRGENAEVRQFNVDDQGLPVPNGRSQWIPIDQSNTIKQDFLRRGRVLYQQRKEAILFTDGMRSEIEWQDDKVNGAMFFHPTGNFFCGAQGCQCQPPKKP